MRDLILAKAATKEMQRLDKCVSHMTGMSRQEASKAIKAGLVLVDGEIITLPTSKVSINSQLRILNDTEDVLEAQFADEGSLDEAGAGSIEGSMSVADAFKKRVYMLNKPDGFVCAARDKNHAVAISLLRSELHSDRLQCVGRLDIDTTGLLLVTDDGALNHELTSPKKQVVKVYIAMLDKAVPEKAVEQFAVGIKHPEETKRYQGAKLTILEDRVATSVVLHNAYRQTKIGQYLPMIKPAQQHFAAVAVTEGRFHEVKRMFEMVGCEVKELVRVAIGSLTLREGIKLGEYEQLSAEDIELLFTNKDYSSAELEALLDLYQQNVKLSSYKFLPMSFRQSLQEHIAAGKDSERANSVYSAVGAGASINFEALSAQIDSASEVDLEVEVDVDADADADAEFEDDVDAFDEVDENGDIRIY